MYEIKEKQNHCIEKDKPYAPKAESLRWFLEDWIDLQVSGFCHAESMDLCG